MGRKVTGNFRVDIQHTLYSVGSNDYIFLLLDEELLEVSTCHISVFSETSILPHSLQVVSWLNQFESISSVPSLGSDQIPQNPSIFWDKNLEANGEDRAASELHWPSVAPLYPAHCSQQLTFRVHMLSHVHVFLFFLHSFSPLRSPFLSLQEGRV